MQYRLCTDQGTDPRFCKLAGTFLGRGLHSILPHEVNKDFSLFSSSIRKGYNLFLCSWIFPWLPVLLVKGRRQITFGSLKPWSNGVTSQCKFANANLHTQTCDGWPNRLASCKKAISVQPCACAHTKENNTEANLHRRALGGQTVKNLRSLACKFELDQSGHVMASPCKPWPNEVANYHKLLTCDNLRLCLARA